MEKQLDFNLNDIINTINRRKIVLISFVAVIVLFTGIYSFLVDPLYESSVVLKKERLYNDRNPDTFNQMIVFQSSDEIENEIETVKSRTVLESVINDFALFFNIQELDLKNTDIQLKDIGLFEYETYLDYKISNIDGRYPKFSAFNISQYAEPGSFYLKIGENKELTIYDATNDSKVFTQPFYQKWKAEFRGIKFTIDWKGAIAGDKLYFDIIRLQKAQKNLSENISVARIGATNLFKISYRSKSPINAQKIVNSIAENFRSSRLNQKKQSIQYSYKFVDQQLQDISVKLDSAETRLSSFKSKNKIINIDETSNEVVKFLSQLETEKIKAELELTEYQNKVSEMKGELKKQGYFDQTYLNPSRTGDSRTPFAALLEQLSDLEIEKLQLLQRRKETHPDIVSINEQINQIQNKLTEYNQNTITSYSIIINSLKKKRNDLNSLIDKYAARIGNLPAQESTLLNLMREKDVYDKMFQLLLDKREELRMAELSKIQDIVVVESASLPIEPVSPKKKLNIMLAMILGSVLGMITIFFQEVFDKKINNVDSLSNSYSLPVLAMIPRYETGLFEQLDNSNNIKNKLVTLMDDKHEFLESYRLLRTQVFNISKNIKKNIFIFTSSDENTGKTTIVANLGVSLTRSGKSVLLIDCDLKKAGLSRLFSVPADHYSIYNYLTDNRSTPVLFKPMKNMDKKFNLSLLAASDSYIEDSSELLENEKMTTLLQYAANKFDYVLIDTAPVTQVVDTLILSKYIPNVFFIVKPKHSFKDGIKYAFDVFKESSINVNGFIINAYDAKSSSYYYKYGYGYGYGYGKENGKAKSKGIFNGKLN
ncbi:MAG: AAA family ATPase [Calditrichae bacterium]|nr:AAA family ATPase [Calditrichota bacterium]MCB9058428.1 AAA family ATPase [Calditrichia bacterium]